MASDSTFGDWLKYRRLQLDLTQIELAERSGCSVNTVRKIEGNSRRPSKQLAQLMADALAIPRDHQESFVSLARADTYLVGVPETLKALDKAVNELQTAPLTVGKDSFHTDNEPERARHNLPSQPTPFLGREKELADLVDYLAEPAKRLITIVGPGGMGKTRLAIACAEQHLGSTRFPDGVFFAALAPLSDIEQIPIALAEALGLSLESGSQKGLSPKQQVLEFVSRKRLLLLFDNFEHLLTGVSLINDLLTAGPGLEIVVTSRERLHLRAEQLYPLQGLEFPEWETPVDAAEYSAVRLFVQSAKQVLPDFELTTPDLTYLSRICRLLSGMPLAVELAAGWADLLSLEDIASELQRNLDFLATELHDVPERQRSIRAIFDASWQQMSSDEREVFPQLSVFPGGFTRQAARAITGATLPLLGRLANKSLLQVDRDRDRFQIHELLRQYAAEKLAKDAEQESRVHDRHSAHYCDFLQQQGKQLNGAEQKSAASRIRLDKDNCVAAWLWAVKRGRIDHLSQALAGLGPFMLDWSFNYQEAARLFAQAAAIVVGFNSVEAAKLMIRLLSWQAWVSDSLGLRDQADQQVQRALTLLEQSPIRQVEDWPAKPATLYRLAIIAHLSDRGHGQELAEQSLALSRKAGNHKGTGTVLSFLAMLTRTQGQSTIAERLFFESLAISRALDDQRGIAEGLYALAETAAEQFRLEEAKILIRESITICRTLDNRPVLAQALLRSGMILVLSGQCTESLAAFQESRHYFGDEGHPNFISHLLSHTGRSHLHLGQYHQAQALCTQSLQVAQQIHKDLPRAQALMVLGQVAMGRAAYTSAEELLQESTTILRTYGKIGCPPFVVMGLSLLSMTLLGQGKVNEARQQLIESATILQHIENTTSSLMSLVAAASLSLMSGQERRAIELYALASTQPFVATSHWFAEVCGHQIDAAATALPAATASAARDRGRSLDWWETCRILLSELV